MNTHQHTARIFFALWPDASARRALSVWQERLSSRGRVMRPDTLHVTLVFLGDVKTARLEALHLAAREVMGKRFELLFDQVRCWEHNRIIHAAPGVIPVALQKLVSDLQCSLTRHGFELEEREYKPHITLLRNARCCNFTLPEMQAVRWFVQEFVMVQGGGPDYPVLARFPLV